MDTQDRAVSSPYVHCTLFQGITYDTGGADIKAGGVMAGMHRDKCGSAAVAGFFQVCSHTHLLILLKIRRILESNIIVVVLGPSQTEAQTPEGCGCDGNGAEQCRIW